MAENQNSDNGNRGLDGKFLPGKSGNPNGRPPGSRNRNSLVIDQLLDGEAEAIARAVIEKAKAGDPGALKLCLDRLAPCRDRMIELKLTAPTKQEEVMPAMNQVIEACTAGEIASREASVLLNLLSRVGGEFERETRIKLMGYGRCL